MTEAEWMACIYPGLMLEFLGRRRTPRKRWDRKLLLFACACCRSIWHLIPTDSCRKAVEVAERFADGLATQQECWSSWSAITIDAKSEGIDLDDPYTSESIDWGTFPGGLAIRATRGLVGDNHHHLDRVVSDAAAEVALDASLVPSGAEASRLARNESHSAEQLIQAKLLRDIFPYQPRRVVLEPTWTQANGNTVEKLAEGIYTDRAFDRLPILADALEDAGCDNADILAHCRGPGPHVRGCWVVDLLLGKQ